MHLWHNCVQFLTREWLNYVFIAFLTKRLHHVMPTGQFGDKPTQVLVNSLTSRQPLSKNHWNITYILNLTLTVTLSLLYIDWCTNSVFYWKSHLEQLYTTNFPLHVGELTSRWVGQSATLLTASWFVGELSGYPYDALLCDSDVACSVWNCHSLITFLFTINVKNLTV